MRGALPTILAIGVKPLTLADIALCAPRDVFMMNITDLAHIADIVAAIGVIGSMIFVGVQVRQSTRPFNNKPISGKNMPICGKKLMQFFQTQGLPPFWLKVRRDAILNKPNLISFS